LWILKPDQLYVVAGGLVACITIRSIVDTETGADGITQYDESRAQLALLFDPLWILKPPR